jgi:hypothetical protein
MHAVPSARRPLRLEPTHTTRHGHASEIILTTK